MDVGRGAIYPPGPLLHSKAPRLGHEKEQKQNLSLEIGSFVDGKHTQIDPKHNYH